MAYKAEPLDAGPNTGDSRTGVVVTTRTDDPGTLYDFYVDRGEAEHWIKDDTRACVADRLSCHRSWADQFRLFLHAAAYWLLDTLRRWLRARGLAPLQLDTLRLPLLKVEGGCANSPTACGSTWPPATPASPSGTSWPPLSAAVNNPG